ncbi:MAG: AI-2E family transporter, partial [Phycisphaerae bacterium]|nr:AI-2E family transporter [Phycisphaerae bacterium]
MQQTVFSPQLNRFITFASLCLVVAVLYVGQPVIEPIVLALLFSFLLTPAVRRLERVGVPRVPACIAVVAAALGLLVLLFYTVTSHAVDLANQLPQYRDNIVQKLSHMPLLHGSALKRIQDTLNDLGQQIATTTNQPTTQPVPVVIKQQGNGFFGVAQNVVNVMVEPAGTVFIVTIFVIFMLLRREDMRDRLIRLVGQGRLDVTTEALAEAGDRITRYLLAQSCVNTCYGIVIGTGLWLIGRFSHSTFPNAPLWGLLAGLLRFIPYLGPWLGAACPVLLSIAVYPHSGQLIATISLFVGVEIINNSAVEPYLYGSSTGMSSLAVLVAAIFWT